MTVARCLLDMAMFRQSICCSVPDLQLQGLRLFSRVSICTGSIQCMVRLMIHTEAD